MIIKVFRDEQVCSRKKNKKKTNPISVKPVAIAGTRTSQIEIFSNGAWEEKGNMIPVHIGDLSLFSTVTFNKELYVFGKIISDSLNTTDLFSRWLQ